MVNILDIRFGKSREKEPNIQKFFLLLISWSNTVVAYLFISLGQTLNCTSILD
jgi:hypothetical protein